ncbi:3-methyladenine DNA glycosylase [Neobacillus terrae]|nr:3-methyladenine DNA glycosylase [Neobacillus terrae]NHM29526.1 3-methyladenine DNA glycosylase [Neobacillus terrae]
MEQKQNDNQNNSVEQNLKNQQNQDIEPERDPKKPQEECSNN